MLKRLNRITKKKEFDNVFKNGRSSFDKIIGIKALDNDLEISRFGIIISTKVSKKAVERNKIKRRIREIIISGLDNITTGKDCIIITLPAIKDKEFSGIEKSIIKHLKRLKVYS